MVFFRLPGRKCRFKRFIGRLGGHAAENNHYVLEKGDNLLLQEKRRFCRMPLANEVFEELEEPPVPSAPRPMPKAVFATAMDLEVYVYLEDGTISVHIR